MSISKYHSSTFTYDAFGILRHFLSPYDIGRIIKWIDPYASHNAWEEGSPVSYYNCHFFEDPAGCIDGIIAIFTGRNWWTEQDQSVFINEWETSIDCLRKIGVKEPKICFFLTPFIFYTSAALKTLIAQCGDEVCSDIINCLFYHNDKSLCQIGEIFKNHNPYEATRNLTGIGYIFEHENSNQ